jgi:hypothetical protein
MGVSMGEFTRDSSHWLRRYSPDEWIRASLAELARADKAWQQHDARAGAASVKRAAGMALNAALIVEPNDAWGRTYVEHLQGLAIAPDVPEAVRAACRLVLEAKGPSGSVVSLRTPSAHAPLLEATRDVIAHAWAVVKRYETTID